MILNYYIRNKNCKYLFLSFVFSFSSLLSCGQNTIKVSIVNLKELPLGLNYAGQVKEALSWTDKTGNNIVLMTETGEYPSKNENSDNYRDAELYAYHFILKKDSIKQSWKVYDFIKDCPVDIQANFIKNTLQITDLNQDSIGEVWLMYKVVCHGDISPPQMKIIMYHGQQKYAMRGRSKVKLSKNQYEGGEYKFDTAFLKGPNKFREFAKQLWNNNIMETTE